jgi:FkbM family methyltransferase
MKDNPRSCEISLSYKWHDRPLRDLEIIVNNFYDLKYYALDIGANHGMRSFYALSLGRPVILFEPNRSLNDFTSSLFNKNGFKNFKLENLCISDSINELDFYISENTYESSLIEFKNHAKKIKVKCTSIDQYMSCQKLSIIPKIIKIDVEGLEYEVIKGAKDLILSHEPSIFVEILPDSKNRNYTMNELFRLGYSCVALKNGIRSKYIELNNKNNFELSKKCTNYFFTKENSILELIHLSK